MRKIRTKLLALTLAVLMLAALLPASALADDNITVYVTVSINGSLGMGKDGQQMTYRPVTVSNGASGLDVIRAAHDQYCPVSGGFVYTQSGGDLEISAVWGDADDGYFDLLHNGDFPDDSSNTTSTFGYLLNDTARQGDFYDLLCTDNENEQTAKFNPPMQSATVGDIATVTYSIWAYTDDNPTVRWIPAGGSELLVNGIPSGIYADDDGSFSYISLKAGTYVLTADPGVETNAACSLLTMNPLFTDVTGHWAEEDINFCALLGYVNGTGGGLFSPNANMTREQLVTMIWRFMGAPSPVSAPKFTDVPVSAYYANAVAWCNENDIVNGITSSVFGVGSLATREQIAAIYYRLACLVSSEVDITDEDGNPITIDTSFNPNVLNSFSDTSSVSDYARDAMAYAVGKGLVTGYPEGTLQPRNNATRAEVTTMLSRFFQSILYDVIFSLPTDDSGDTSGDSGTAPGGDDGDVSGSSVFGGVQGGLGSLLSQAKYVLGEIQAAVN